MSGWLDPVAVIRAAVQSCTGAPTTRVLDPDFTSGPMPLAHVFLVSMEPGDIDRTATIGVDVYAITPSAPDQDGAQALAGMLVSAVDGAPLETPAGFCDDVVVTQVSGVRPYFEAVETVSVTVAVTYRHQS